LILKNNLEKVKLGCTNNKGETPIHIVCKYSTFENIKFMLEQTINVDAIINNNKDIYDYLKENHELSENEKYNITNYLIPKCKRNYLANQ